MKKEKERNKELNQNKDWHAAMAATIVAGNSTYWVQSGNTTCEVALSEGLAWRYIDQTRAPRHLFHVYERDKMGVMRLCRR